MSQSTREYSQTAAQPPAAPWIPLAIPICHGWHENCSRKTLVRTSDIVLVLGALTSSGLACASRTPAQVTEVPAGSPREGPESLRPRAGRSSGTYTPQFLTALALTIGAL